MRGGGRESGIGFAFWMGEGGDGMAAAAGLPCAALGAGCGYCRRPSVILGLFLRVPTRCHAKSQSPVIVEKWLCAICIERAVHEYLQGSA